MTGQFPAEVAWSQVNKDKQSHIHDSLLWWWRVRFIFVYRERNMSSSAHVIHHIRLRSAFTSLRATHFPFPQICYCKTKSAPIRIPVRIGAKAEPSPLLWGLELSGDGVSSKFRRIWHIVTQTSKVALFKMLKGRDCFRFPRHTIVFLQSGLIYITIQHNYICEQLCICSLTAKTCPRVQ